MIRFRNATNRSTPCYTLDIGRVSLTISYETVIAACYKQERIRLRNIGGTTTKRHMRETGVDDYDEFTDKEFNERVTSMVLRSIADTVEQRLS